MSLPHDLPPPCPFDFNGGRRLQRLHPLTLPQHPLPTAARLRIDGPGAFLSNIGQDERSNFEFVSGSSPDPLPPWLLAKEWIRSAAHDEDANAIHTQCGQGDGVSRSGCTRNGGWKLEDGNKNCNKLQMLRLAREAGTDSGHHGENQTHNNQPTAESIVDKAGVHLPCRRVVWEQIELHKCKYIR